jgi:histidyl-tRNA synthetase
LKNMALDLGKREAKILLLKAPKGTKDVLPQESYRWQFVEAAVREVTARAGYREIRTPVFEHTELFLRGVGDTTDIVQKEMYTFLDKGGRSITLKPEGTAGVVRAFIESGLAGGAQPTKIFYLSTPVFRYERPQSGRLREHHQFGVEVFGAADASVDAEVISIAIALLQKVGVKNLRLDMNSIGCTVCRPRYHQKLKAYLMENYDELCKTCRERSEKNPLRILDCKESGCSMLIAQAPVMVDHLCEECTEHFMALRQYLEAMDISYTVNPRIVRGLDYYTKTVFEILSDHIGAQGTVCGGGRYDRLVEEIGGPNIAGIGFGMGIERLLMVMEHEGVEVPVPSIVDVYICTHGGMPERTEAARLLKILRENGINADMDHTGRSIKAQFKYADKTDAHCVVVIGERERENGTAVLKKMQTGEELVVKREEIINFL